MFSVFTGTAANLLGPGQLLPLFETVICAGSAHLNVDECGRRIRFWAPGC